jgi:CDP-glucose 4,6-dehydratase
MFNNQFKEKKVLITGNTGFKGSWLSLWLKLLGADVYGFSIDVPTDPSLFAEAKLEEKINHKFIDIRDKTKVFEYLTDVKPDYIFHLAAQPLVLKSYQDPHLTHETNILGTLNILDWIRATDFDGVGVIITSDKAYKNVEWEFGYRENDTLGGDDPYSASKGAAEIVSQSYITSFFKKSGKKVVTARAGNVIGGGDWALDRIVPDIFKSWKTGSEVIVRSPESTRPWQHVLEPLSGYLALASKLSTLDKSDLFPEAFNFGPGPDVNKSVIELISHLGSFWPNNKGSLIELPATKKLHEANLLKLSCDRANIYLNWFPTLTFNDTMRFTGKWYYECLNSHGFNAENFTNAQIIEYMNIAKQKNIAWMI